MTDVLSWIRSPGPLLIGHRGYAAVARENTGPGFEAALEAGCDGVELDVRMTADGMLVVHHDEVAQGEAGPVRIEAAPWNVLRDGRFLAPDHPYRIPRLDIVLGELQQRALVNVEVKPPEPGRHRDVAVRVAAALELIRPRESILVSSFDPGVLQELRAVDPSILLGYLFSWIEDFNRLEQDDLVDHLTSLHPRHDLLDRKLAKRAGERGLWIATWTVNDPGEAARVLGLGARAVITDRPEQVEETLWGSAPE